MARAKQQHPVEVPPARVGGDEQAGGPSGGTNHRRAVGVPDNAPAGTRGGGEPRGAAKGHRERSAAPEEGRAVAGSRTRGDRAAPAVTAPGDAVLSSAATASASGVAGLKPQRSRRAKAAEPPERRHNGHRADTDQAQRLFLEHQRELLVAERNSYTRQAEELRAQAEALALEHEPGDVQFDEEGGEGGTANVDRELDLHLSAQAQAAVEEIDDALAKITAGSYGLCESCGAPIPRARLEAIPHARLCVSCKSGGLTARRQ